MFIEKRAFPRYKADFPVKYQLLEDKEEVKAILEHSKKEIAIARDISLGGMQITSEQPLKNGDVLVFEIPLADKSQTLLASAEVVWVNGNISGLHFLQISNEDLEALKAYLKKLGYRS